jgi:hypothetical protein
MTSKVSPMQGMDDLISLLTEYVEAGRAPAPAPVPGPRRDARHYPASLRAGDVFEVGDSGPLTYVSDTVKPSNPKIALITVKERGQVIELDAFDKTPRIRMISRGSVDGIFGPGLKGKPHRYIPLTDDPDRCGECGDGKTPNHLGIDPQPAMQRTEFERRVAALTKPGDLPGLGYVDAFEVADGVYAYVRGVLPTGEQASLTGYVLGAFEVVGNFEGWTPDDGVVVMLAEHPEHLDGVPVYVPGDKKLVVVDTSEALSAVSVNTAVRPSLAQALARAGLKLGDADGRGVVSRHLAWTSRNPEEKLAERMFSSRGGAPAGAGRPVLRQEVVAKAMADGVWPGPAEVGPVPLRLVREGAHGTLTGTVDGGLTDVTGEFMYWWSDSHGADRRATVKVQMRVPDQRQPGQYRVLTVQVPATGVVFHLDPGAAGSVRPVPVAQVEPQQGDLLAGLLGELEQGLAALTPRVIPLAEVEWGMYGRIGKGSGIYPDGSQQRKDEVGWITSVPRVYTGGEGGANNPKWRGKPLLSTFVSYTGQVGGTSVYAFPDATFTLLDPPEGERLAVPKILSRRLPVADLRRGDVFYIWTETRPGVELKDLPRYHVQDTPVALDKRTSALPVLADGKGEVTTLTLGSWNWIDVQDPRKWPWVEAE